MAQVGSGGRGGRGRGLAARLGARPGAGVLVALVCVLVCAVVVGLFALGRPGGVVVERAAETADAAPSVGDEAPAPATTVTVSRLTVHVDGAVASPGVYVVEGELPRVNDAIVAAGGLGEGADTSGLNLAAAVADGDKVHVPLESEEQPIAPSEPAGSSQASAQGGTTSSGLVNINRAGVEELDALPGVGQSTAQAIVDDRDANGAFASIEDLMRVSGIGEKKFEKLKGKICV